MAILTSISSRSPRGCSSRHWLDLRVFLCAVLAMAAGWIARPPVSIAQEPAASEYQVKAAFLVNFPKYAEWPAEAFAQTNSPIVITVLAETRVAEEVRKLIAGRTFNGREIVLQRLASGEEPGVCHILFISAAEQHHSPALLGKLKYASTLTVGESDDFLEGGGIINLARQNRKVALEVNLTAASYARIKISSRLLNVARVVEGKSQ